MNEGTAEDFQKDKCKAFGIVLGQCRQLTKEVVKADKTYRTIEKADDVTGLSSIIRDLCYGTDKKRYVRWVQQAQFRRALTMGQETTETLQQFATNFLEQVKAFEDVCGPLVPVRDVIKRVEQTRIVGEGDDAVEETYTVPVPCIYLSESLPSSPVASCIPTRISSVPLLQVYFLMGLQSLGTLAPHHRGLDCRCPC